ncbi:MAG: hypothetical protein LBP41_01775 [Holosporaceae bacterium]|jgi:hypothetical protein|nr:hypothetical protein [Holosporaceae bacterium]
MTLQRFLNPKNDADVMCRDSKESRFIIEMQCAADTRFIRLAGVDPDIVVRTSGLSPDEIESFRNSDPGK